jgi:CheY-like chemotaxis protein
MEMPRLRGTDCLIELRRLRPGLKAVLCSGYSREETQADDFDAIICKPFNLARLAQVLDEVMGSR